MTRWTLALIIVVGVARTAAAQDVPPELELQPVTEAAEVQASTAIDLESVVTSAAKSATTVQEAPAIVTIVTADDIRRWGFRDMNDVLTSVPGWFHSDSSGENFQGSAPRGIVQGSLMLHDGIPMFDPFGNDNAVNRALPLESIKRVEIVTGPGGVLWGAQSYLGIYNIITKDADDVPGTVEGSVGFGDGRGDRSDFRAWLMTGLRSGRFKLF